MLLPRASAYLAEEGEHLLIGLGARGEAVDEERATLLCGPRNAPIVLWGMHAVGVGHVWHADRGARGSRWRWDVRGLDDGV